MGDTSSSPRHSIAVAPSIPVPRSDGNPEDLLNDRTDPTDEDGDKIVPPAAIQTNGEPPNRTRSKHSNKDQIMEMEPPYSIYSNGQKIAIILSVSFMAIISPLSGAIYLPAIPALSQDLNVSASLINLTVTTYLAS
jgi:hypothetical protein